MSPGRHQRDPDAEHGGGQRHGAGAAEGGGDERVAGSAHRDLPRRLGRAGRRRYSPARRSARYR